MKRKIKAVFAGTVATGAYENEKPLFEIEEEHSAIMTDDEILGRQAILYEICKKNFIGVQRRSIADRIKLEKEGIRLYPIAEKNKDYPSVTSITSWDSDFNMPDTDLAQYGARGTLIHKMCEHYDEHGGWLSLQELVSLYPELYVDYSVLKKGSRQLSVEGYNYPTFLKKYPIEHIASEQVMVNHELAYAGRLDKIGIPKMNSAWEKIGAKPVKSVIDFKTSSAIDLKKFGPQLCGYAHGEGLEDIEQCIIIHLKGVDKVKRGWGDPVVFTPDKYWEEFKVARQIFRKRFGI